MPPAKGSRSTAKRSVKSAGKQRLSQLARENQISNEQEELICEAFHLFSLHGIEGYEEEEHGILRVQDVRRVLIALEMPVEEMREWRQQLDSDNTGYVMYPVFLSYAARRMELLQDEEVDDEEHMQEVQKAFELFTHNGPGPIHIGHLKRVARLLKEDVSDDQLVNMVRVANGRIDRRGWEAGVTMTEFERVLEAAGAWRRN